MTGTYQDALTEARAAATKATVIDVLQTGKSLFGFDGMPLTFVVAEPDATLDELAELLIEQAVISLAQARRAAQLMGTVGGAQ